MKILIFDKKGTGCWWFRTHLPFLNVTDHEIVYAEKLEEVDLEKTFFDIVIVSRILSGDLYSITEFFKWKGTRLVYEIDDGLDVIPAVNPVYPMSGKGRESMEHFLREADLVTVTTERLAQHVAARRKGKPVLVLPNCIDVSLLPKRNYDTKYVHPRVGYTGSVTHLEDVIPFLDGVIEAQEKLDFTTVLFGFNDKHDSWQEFIDTTIAIYESKKLGRGAIVTALNKLRVRLSKIKNLEWHKAVPLEQYPQKLASLNLDLGVCPLEDTRFNALKSDCKVLEYVMNAGCPAIASKVPPYSDTLTNAWLVSEGGWATALLKVLPDVGLRTKLHDEQVKWIMENRQQSFFTEERLKAYAAII